jgi:glucosylceramidase
MAAQGITIWGVCPQNEPLNANNEPSMTMSATEELNFINNNLGPTLRNAGYSTKIICYDHNCDNTSYPTTVAKGSSYVDGSAFHLYAGSISALTTVKNATGKNVYFTEQYTASSGSFSGDFPWHMQNVMIGSVNNWAKIALEWNLAANSSCDPHTSGGCTVCLPGVTVSSSSYSKNVAYYIVAHMSKFVRPGALRCNTSTTDSGLLNTAFINGTTATVVVLNASGGSRTFSILHGGSRVTATLANNSAGTFTWNTSGTSSTPTPTSATATATTGTATATPTPGSGTSSLIALKASANNLYVCAENAGASALIARSAAIGTWEKFTRVNQ